MTGKLRSFVYKPSESRSYDSRWNQKLALKGGLHSQSFESDKPAKVHEDELEIKFSYKIYYIQVWQRFL